MKIFGIIDYQKFIFSIITIVKKNGNSPKHAMNNPYGCNEATACSRLFLFLVGLPCARGLLPLMM